MHFSLVFSKKIINISKIRFDNIMNYNISPVTCRIKRLVTAIILFIWMLPLPGQVSEKNDSVSVASKSETAKITEDEQKMVWVSLYAGAGLSQWNHSIEEVTMDPALEIGGGLALNFRIVDWLEVSTGVGISLFSFEAVVENYNATMPAIDNEGDEYEKQIYASDVIEEQKFVWLNIPMAVRYVFNFGRWDIYGGAGAEYRMALKSSYEQEGVFSHHGYYEQYDLLIDDLPDLGFYNERSMYKDDDLEMDDMLLPFVEAGVVFPGKKSHFFIEGRYYFHGSDPFGDKQEVLFPGPSDNENVVFFNNESVMKSGDISFSGIRGVIGIRF